MWHVQILQIFEYSTPYMCTENRVVNKRWRLCASGRGPINSWEELCFRKVTVVAMWFTLEDELGKFLVQEIVQKPVPGNNNRNAEKNINLGTC